MIMPVRTYEVLDEKDVSRQGFKDAGIPVVKNKGPSISERIGTAGVRAGRRLREAPGYIKKAAVRSAPYVKRAAMGAAGAIRGTPEQRASRKGKIMKFLEKQGQAGRRPANNAFGGFGTSPEKFKPMGMDYFIGGGKTRVSRKGKARRRAPMKWF